MHSVAVKDLLFSPEIKLKPSIYFTDLMAPSFVEPLDGSSTLAPGSTPQPPLGLLQFCLLYCISNLIKLDQFASNEVSVQFKFFVGDLKLLPFGASGALLWTFVAGAEFLVVCSVNPLVIPWCALHFDLPSGDRPPYVS